MTERVPRGGRRGRVATEHPIARAAPGAALRVAFMATLVTALVAALAACVPAGGSPRPAPTTSSATTGTGPSTESPPGASPASGDPTALAAAARTAGTAVQSGDVTLTVAALAAPVATAAQHDGSVVVTFTVAAGGPTGADAASRRLVAVLATPPGLRFVAEVDRSVTVRGGGGAVLGALPPVVAVDGAGERLGARLAVRESDATLVDVLVDALVDVLVDAGPAGAATVVFGATPLASATWGEREGGRSLAVVPAAWVRAGSLAAQDALWSALVAVEPEADSTTMHDQLTCHALGASDKDSWNLEPWRPEVDSITLLASRCNP